MKYQENHGKHKGQFTEVYPMNWKTMPVHPLAAMFPRPTEVEFQALIGDLKDRGYDKDHPIYTVNGSIIDGISRRDACIEAGVEPVFKEHKSNDLLGFVLARNLHRRHLTTSQRQMLAADISDYQKISVEGANLHPSREKAAKDLNVSERGVKAAASVKREAEPEVVDAVRNGTITVHDATEVKDETPAKQRKAVRDVQAGRATTARGALHPGAAAEAAAARRIKTQAKEAEKQERSEQKPTEIPTDANGKKYPEQAWPAIQGASRLAQLERYLRDGIELAEQIGKEPIGLYLDPSGIRQRLTEAKALVLAAHPKHICKNCDGEDKKCKWCKGHGWQTRGGYMQCPEPK